ncbi:MAG: hypothetical protein JNJ59_25110, partial [Deltaproteobacteria bacterium]|nr:hypothetical protein [Deltaproteobacteria bacterium]
CPAGYAGTGATGCVDIDECLTQNGGCDSRTSCQNMAGGRTCGACPAGFTGTGATGCVDVDECKADNGGCHYLVTCQNTAGGRTCGPCPAGFTGDGLVCVEAAPLPIGAVEQGGATAADMEAVRDDWDPILPEDRNELAPKPGVATTTESQADEVVVTPEALRFDRHEHPEVLAWERGRIIVSTPGESGASGRNPFGFIRKVEAVQVEGDEVVIKTTVPALEEVFTGEVQMEFDATTAKTVDWDEFDHRWAAQNLYQDVGLIGDHFPEALTDDESLPDRNDRGEIIVGDPLCCKWVSKVTNAVTSAVSNAVDAVKETAVSVYQAVIPSSFEGTLRLDRELSLSAKSGVFNYTFSKAWAEPGKPGIEARFSGAAEFEGSMTFNPRTSIGVRIPNPIGPNPPPFKIWMDIDAYFNTYLKLDIDLEAALASVEGKSGGEMQEAFDEVEGFAQSALTYFKVKSLGDADAKPAGGWKKTLYISKPSTQWVQAGPVPVVFTQTFQLDLECGFEVKANLHASLEHSASRTFKFRAEYEKGGNAFISAPEFNSQTSRTVTVEGGGEASISCGLIPRVNAFVYDMVGINLGLRGSGVVRAKYESTCDPDPVKTQPKGEVKLGLYANVGVQFGGRVQAPGSSYAGSNGNDLGFDIGPYELWTKEWPIIERTWEVPGLGYCTPTCKNGRTSPSEQETDVDCGDACATACVASQHCRVNRDCKNGLYCSGGTCSDNHCGDGVLSGDETAIDCGGARCGGCAVDRACAEHRDCLSNACRKGSGLGTATDMGSCVADPCLDGTVSPGECGVDCGGSCALCRVGIACAQNAGCASGISNGAMCVPGNCGNLRQDGTESDVDCGGGLLCARCAPGRHCNFDSDCSAAAPICDPDTRLCALAQCINGQKDASEGDVDCGGACEAKCAAGANCRVNSDCALGLECEPGTKVCKAPSCNDGWKSMVEGDVDCGKSCPQGCELGQTCKFARDCVSDICSGGRCVDSDCFDGQKNGQESDTDCGGSCVRQCATGKRCAGDGDCASKHCEAGVCAAASCVDQIVNGNESDRDCGGPCGGCEAGRVCRVGSDCASRNCDGFVCAAPSCVDGIKNGDEGDRDCGGTCPERCVQGRLCNLAADCASNTCLGGICADARCSDGYLNGDESDLDCGGTCPVKCTLGKACLSGSDCDTLACDGGLCVAPRCDDGVANGAETGRDCGGVCRVDYGIRCEPGEGCQDNDDCDSRSCVGEVCIAARCDDGVENGNETAIDCGGDCGACPPERMGGLFASSASNAQGFVVMGTTAYFVADDGVSGYELWREDANGVARVADLNPNGAAFSISPLGNSEPPRLLVFGSSFYFAATDGTSGVELWKSDGTLAGTMRVKDIAPGSASASPTELTVSGGALYFRASDGVSGAELWKSDGTDDGTVLVKDIWAGTNGSTPNTLRAAGANLFFVASTAESGAELWVSNGTSAGTRMVADLRPGSTGSLNSPHMAALGATLFFNADDGTRGSELWMSDGSAEGTILLKDIQPGAAGSSVQMLRAGANRVYFAADDGTSGGELWTSDGTAAGTVRLKDINPGSGSSFVSEILVNGNSAWFRATDPASGAELWKTDGTPAGTVLVKDINPGATGGFPIRLVQVGAILFFIGNDGSTGNELWRSDGTAAGTIIVADLMPGTAGAFSGNLPLAGGNGKAYFGADDGIGGLEPWTSDGTAAGTIQIGDVNTSPSGSPSILGLGGRIYFTSFEAGSGQELWSTNGTAAGTAILADVNPGAVSSNPAQLTAVGQKLYFVATDPLGAELWVTDGTVAGTRYVSAPAGRPRAFYQPTQLAAVGQKLFFSALLSGFVREPFSSDGTAEGTGLIKELNPGTQGGSAPAFPVALGGNVLFTANTAANGYEL